MQDLAKQNVMMREISYTVSKYPSLDLGRQVGSDGKQKRSPAQRPRDRFVFNLRTLLKTPPVKSPIAKGLFVTWNF